MDGGGLLAAMGLESLAMPFVVRIWIVFLACLVIGVAVSLITAAPREDRPVQLSGIRFATEPVFNLAGLAIIAILIAIYGIFW
jgi:SSS family solute:Na+ symporter